MKYTDEIPNKIYSKARLKARKELIDLQNEWYQKLAYSGFNDLEWLDKKTGAGQNTPYLKKNLHKFSNLSKTELFQRVEYFTGAQEFSQHHKFCSRLHQYVWDLYIQGISYRNMIPLIRSRRFKHVPSIFWISTHLTELKKAYEAWQLEQPDEPESLAKFMEDNRGIP